MEYLQYLVYTPLDKVVHEGLSPNPLHVVLIAQSLSCRYKTSFNDQEPRLRVSNTDVEPQFATGAWQLILKVAGFRCKRKKQCAYVYEAVNLQGACVFFSISNSVATTAFGVFLEAVVEACFTTFNRGF